MVPSRTAHRLSRAWAHGLYVGTHVSLGGIGKSFPVEESKGDIFGLRVIIVALLDIQICKRMLEKFQ